MNIVLNFILFNLLGIYCSYSSSLVCYVCQNCADPADLNGFTNDTCPGPCIKIHTYIPTMGVYIYKACTTTCTETSLYFGFSTFNVKCCNDTNRCNTGQYSAFSNRLNQLIMTYASITLLLVFHQSTTMHL